MSDNGSRRKIPPAVRHPFTLEGEVTPGRALDELCRAASRYVVMRYEEKNKQDAGQLMVKTCRRVIEQAMGGNTPLRIDRRALVIWLHVLHDKGGLTWKQAARAILALTEGELFRLVSSYERVWTIEGGKEKCACKCKGSRLS